MKTLFARFDAWWQRFWHSRPTSRAQRDADFLAKHPETPARERFCMLETSTNAPEENRAEVLDRWLRYAGLALIALANVAFVLVVLYVLIGKVNQ
ncbi:MAG: hypothetical protein AB1705_15355 [Verrucomicrobiota bacterium]